MQKQFGSTVAMFGGVHLPCTSYSTPQFEAQAGSTDVNGTMGPSAACGFCERVRERRESRMMVVVGCIFADYFGWFERWVGGLYRT